MTTPRNMAHLAVVTNHEENDYPLSVQIITPLLLANEMNIEKMKRDVRRNRFILGTVGVTA